MKRLVLCAALLAAGPAYADSCAPASEVEIATIRDAMEIKLLDSDSARIRDVCVHDGHDASNGKKVYCGIVNAKNRMGAYVGFTEFSYVSGAKSATIVDQASNDMTSKYFYCAICTPSRDCDALLN